MLLLVPMALAADLTQMPDALEVEAAVAYQGTSENAGLVEADTRVADRRYRAHAMQLRAGFAPARGIAFHVAADVTVDWMYTFTNHRTMQLEPVDGGGTYLDAPVIEAPVGVGGSGLNGIWFGASLAPFSERYAKFHRITWKLDLAVRTGSARDNRWTVDNGRGGGPGGTAVRFGAAFSRRTGVSEPYVAGSYQHEGAVEVDVRDEQGRGALLQLDPPSIAELRGGCELHTETDLLAVDVWIGVRATTPAQIPSGILLPDVLDSAKTIAVTHSDHVAGQAGLNLHVAFAPFLDTSLGVFGRYTVPHRQEHVFPVRTDTDAVTIGWTADLVARFGVGKSDD
jgi:hypothetical protein